MIVVTQYGHTQLKKRDSYANNRHAIWDRAKYSIPNKLP